jgi:uncharacterized protein YcbK (DUF882 family)
MFGKKDNRSQFETTRPDAQVSRVLSKFHLSPRLSKLGVRMDRRRIIICLVALFIEATFLSVAFSMETKIFHTVAKGDSVAKICDFYGVSQRDLRELNGLKEDKALKTGQVLKIPNVLRVPGTQYTIKEGDTLALIGEEFHQTPKRIAFANKLAMDKPLIAGRTIVIPDGEVTGKKIQIKGDEPSPIQFLRIKTGERERLNLYSKSGEVIFKSVKALSYLARDLKGDQKSKRLHYRLIRMIEQVAEKFEDKPIEIISGYRPQSSGSESQHAFGRALDFRISGAAAKTVFNFCKTLPRSGCGYYPNADFVHMDARSRSATWIDRSTSKWSAD